MSDLLTSLETRLTAKRLRMVFAAEAGSRAWGFASPDSDYDARFVFMSERDRYLSLFDPIQDINYLDHPMDYAGWDLKKALVLASKSNPSLIEWLGSPIIYRDNFGFRDKLRKVMEEQFSPKNLAHHYINFMRNIRGKYMSDFIGEYTMKRYFYAIRPIASVIWMQANPWKLPPVKFADTLAAIELKPDERREIETLQRLKAEAIEQADYKSPILDALVHKWFDQGHDIAKTFSARSMRIDDLSAIFRETLEA
jgi:predicted nucleotidyltransferase